ncbi:MAG TPA: zf-HC2 domain-containing protein [Kofleriaceae bacterium]|nr:zf-HC2 domain-containing protein [Kofleriaceae bacterium]
MTVEPEPTPAEDEIIAMISDYLDGALPAERRAEVEQKIASDPEWKRVHTELRETRDNLSGLLKARPPADFGQKVEDKIHKRSAGRFFARRTLGDRVPFSAILVLALIVLIAVGYVMWSSQTGTLKVDHRKAPPATGSQSIVPKP